MTAGASLHTPKRWSPSLEPKNIKEAFAGSPRAASRRRAKAEEIAARLLAAGAGENEVYCASQPDFILDLATEGTLQEALGRQRRRSVIFPDQAAREGADRASDYRAFLAAREATHAHHVVIRAPGHLVPIGQIREAKQTQFAAVSEKLRYVFNRYAPRAEVDFINVEMDPIAPRGDIVDLHFHASIRGRPADIKIAGEKFSKRGWRWWSDCNGREDRDPGRLAVYTNSH